MKKRKEVAESGGEGTVIYFPLDMEMPETKKSPHMPMPSLAGGFYASQ